MSRWLIQRHSVNAPRLPKYPSLEPSAYKIQRTESAQAVKSNAERRSVIYHHLKCLEYQECRCQGSVCLAVSRMLVSSFIGKNQVSSSYLKHCGLDYILFLPINASYMACSFVFSPRLDLTFVFASHPDQCYKVNWY